MDYSPYQSYLVRVTEKNEFGHDVILPGQLVWCYWNPEARCWEPTTEPTSKEWVFGQPSVVGDPLSPKEVFEAAFREGRTTGRREVLDRIKTRSDSIIWNIQEILKS